MPLTNLLQTISLMLFQWVLSLVRLAPPVSTACLQF